MGILKADKFKFRGTQCEILSLKVKLRASLLTKNERKENEAGFFLELGDWIVVGFIF